MKAALTIRAQADLEAIGEYIAQDNPNRAVSFIRELRDHCDAIAEAPKAYAVRTDLRDLRCCPHGNYLILFRIKKDEIQIVRVIHAAQDARDLGRHGNLNEPRAAYNAASDFEALGFLRAAPIEDYNRRRRMAEVLRHAGTCSELIRPEELQQVRRKR